MPYHSPRWDSRWQALYRAAIFEQNSSCAEGLIAQAEAAIAIRRNELAQSSGPSADAEREGEESALYALKALRTAQNVSSAA